MSTPALLIIDDEPAIGTLIGRVGEACGYRVTVVSDSRALDAQFESDPPTVICLDLAMPGTDGIEVLRLLAAQRCEAHLLIISGYNGAMVGAAVRFGEALGLNIGGVLPKPIRMAELRDLLLQLTQPGRPAAA